MVIDNAVWKGITDLAGQVIELCNLPGNELPDEVFNLAQSVREVEWLPVVRN